VFYDTTKAPHGASCLQGRREVAADRTAPRGERVALRCTTESGPGDRFPSVPRAPRDNATRAGDSSLYSRHLLGIEQGTTAGTPLRERLVEARRRLFPA
jgi:hypothetical protein